MTACSHRLDCAGSSAYWFSTGGRSPLFRREVWNLEARVQVGRELAPEQGEKVGAESDLNDIPRRVLAQDVPDRSLGVEEADRNAGGLSRTRSPTDDVSAFRVGL